MIILPKWGHMDYLPTKSKLQNDNELQFLQMPTRNAYLVDWVCGVMSTQDTHCKKGLFFSPFVLSSLLFFLYFSGLSPSLPFLPTYLSTEISLLIEKAKDCILGWLYYCFLSLVQERDIREESENSLPILCSYVNYIYVNI